jgi:uncharacterized protein
MTLAIDRPVASTRRTGRAPRDRHGLEVLAHGECLELLSSQVIGRVGLCEAGLPTVLPVNYVVDGDNVLVCTGTGSLLRSAAARSAVVLEVDGVDKSAGVMWSVLVRGVATEVTEPDALDHPDARGLACWGRPAPSRLIRVRGYEITGRRAALVDRDSNIGPPGDRQ